MQTFEIETPRHEALVDVTAQVRQAVRDDGRRQGLCVIYVPHTTAAVTINECADPDVAHDIVLGLQKALPNLSGFRHGEGNSAAHLKSSLIGCSVSLPIVDGALLLGTWQGIFFCEFDGPRHRRFHVCLYP